jgi:hypothetical protein
MLKGDWYTFQHQIRHPRELSHLPSLTALGASCDMLSLLIDLPSLQSVSYENRLNRYVQADKGPFLD